MGACQKWRGTSLTCHQSYSCSAGTNPRPAVIMEDRCFGAVDASTSPDLTAHNGLLKPVRLNLLLPQISNWFAP
jgi:hypothetical protein